MEPMSPFLISQSSLIQEVSYSLLLLVGLQMESMEQVQEVGNGPHKVVCASVQRKIVWLTLSMFTSLSV